MCQPCAAYLEPVGSTLTAILLQNKRYAQALELAKKDKLYKDAMATAATSQVIASIVRRACAM